MSLLDQQPLKWDEWKEKLVNEFVRQAKFLEDEVRQMLQAQGDECWKEYWRDAYSPSSAVAEEMSYWDDDETEE